MWKQEGETAYITVGRKKFADWLREDSGSSEADVRRMTGKARRQVYLRWKHRTKDMSIAEALEAHDREMMEHYKQREAEDWVNEDAPEFCKRKLRWLRGCAATWMSLKSGNFFTQRLSVEAKATVEHVRKEFQGTL